MQKGILSLVLAIMVVVAGCSGGQPAPAAPAAPTSPPASAATATSIPPTVGPSPTTAPTNTVPPPTATLAPTTAASSPITVAAASTGGNCDNVYYPVHQGATWVYKTTLSSTAPITTTESDSNVTSTSFVRTITSNKGAIQLHWTCTASGLTQGELNPGNASLSFHLKVLKASGITLPPADQWTAGKTWKATYQVTMQSSPVAGAAAAVVTGGGTMTMTDKILGKESVTVPAGTYDAWKVSSTLVENLSMKMNGRAVPVKTQIAGTNWYARNVGEVKSIISGGSTVLVSYKP